MRPLTGQVSDNVSHKLIWGRYLNFHYWFKKNHIGMSCCFLNRQRAGNFKSNFGRIYLMVASVVNNNFHICHRESSQNTVLHFFSNSLFYCRNKLRRNCTTFNLALPFIPFTTSFRFNSQETMSVLSSTSGLTNVFSLSLSYLFDGFFVSDLRSTCFCVNSKFPFHPVH